MAFKSEDDLSLFWPNIFLLIYNNIQNGDVKPGIDKLVSNLRIAESDQNGVDPQNLHGVCHALCSSLGAAF